MDVYRKALLFIYCVFSDKRYGFELLDDSHNVSLFVKRNPIVLDSGEIVMWFIYAACLLARWNQMLLHFSGDLN